MPLTLVQWWVLRFRAAGLSPDETGLYIGLSRTEVWRHSSAAFGRLGATSLIEAMAALGWLSTLPDAPPEPVMAAMLEAEREEAQARSARARKAALARWER